METNLLLSFKFNYNYIKGWSYGLKIGEITLLVSLKLILIQKNRNAAQLQLVSLGEYR